MPEPLRTRPLTLKAKDGGALSEREIHQALRDSLRDIKPGLRRVLLIPPDYTRLHSNAGLITRLLYHDLAPDCQVDILPALGTHVPVSRAEWDAMFGDVPYDAMLVHNWRDGLTPLGEVPADFVREVSEGYMDTAVPVEVSSRVATGGYDLILSIGQVVPHEVIGMANHSKNIFVGCGGSRMINATHMLGALYGMERIMGKDRTPVRAVLDYALEHYAKDWPLTFILTVTTAPEGNIKTHGLFIGHQRKAFEDAVALARETNIIWLDKPVKTAVVCLDEIEFKSTWLGNKAVYRTRMAIADGGELVVLAPGVDKFGEDAAVDKLIRRFGYRGRDRVLADLAASPELAGNLSAAAHLIHGSSEGRFSITYCPRHLTRQEVEQVGYNYLPYEEAVARYKPDSLKEGWNQTADGQEIFFIENPALGLWIDRSTHG